MKKTTLLKFRLISVALFIIGQCSYAEDSNRKFDFVDFSKVSVSNGMEITISQSTTYSIQVEGAANDLKHLKVEKSDHFLKFYCEKTGWHQSNSITIQISMPILTELDLSGGSEAKIKMNQPDEPFACDFSGGSTIMGELICKETTIETSGGSEIKLTGTGGNLEASGSGGSEFRLQDFSVLNVDAELSGGSELYITMNGELNVDASGGSEIIFYGKAEYGRTDLSGGSSVNKGR